MQAIPRHVEERTPTQGLKKRTKSTWRGKGHRKKKNRDVTPLNIYYIYCLIVCADVHLCVCHRKGVEVGGQLAGIGSTYMGSGDQTQVVKLGDKCPHLLNSAFVFRLER